MWIWVLIIILYLVIGSIVLGIGLNHIENEHALNELGCFIAVATAFLWPITMLIGYGIRKNNDKAED